MKSKTLTARLSVLLMVVVLVAVALTPVASVAAPVDLGFDVRYTGVITTVGDEDTAWVIGGQTLATNADTQVVLTTTTVEAGMWAEVVAKRQADDSLLARMISVRPEQVRLQGMVISKPDDNIGDWVIAGVTVMVTPDTAIAGRGGSTDVGDWVEAVMSEDGGVLTAQRIMGISAQEFVVISGEIQGFSDTSWIVSAMTLAVEPYDQASGQGTLISGNPVVGLIAHAVAELREDGSLLARGLRVAWIDANALLPLTEFNGLIEQLPADGLRGEWVVGGQNVVVMPNTRIHQEKGLAVVGALVHVVGWQLLDRVVASEITVLESPVEGGQYTIFIGLIEALPALCDANGCLGFWTVGGQAVEVNERTVVLGSVPQLGSIAHVEGVQRSSDDVVVASTVRVRAMPRITVTPPPIPTRPPLPTRPPRP